MQKVYVLHENMDWTRHLIKRLEELAVPYQEWDLSEGFVDLAVEPPEGIFYNRMSASSHTRGNRFAPELTDQVLSWLEAHGRTVINGTDALALEVSKLKQYLALNKVGIETPKTIGAVGLDQIIKAAEKLNEWPFIIKHNRAGKGLGVKLIYTIDELKAYINGPEFEASIDGISLIQQYIQSTNGRIVRAEFIGGEFFYTVEVDSSDGFELCPADNCQLPDESTIELNGQPAKFEIQENLLSADEIEQYRQFMQESNVQVAALEFIRDQSGKLYTYDVNTNTNYNPEAEQRANQYAMLQLATYLKEVAEEDE
ncbi:ATP-grasp domain-containing protein [Marinilactibacillus kalidii]|uniref:ATP-grasp domain-containing protein n=1 Tax=Marinilactibacillus kalidii TaxID=2820274 RepID=UPI001FC924F5|nr:alpha-L-glutamate ligase [Marinilactibacillus kalidii]